LVLNVAKFYSSNYKFEGSNTNPAWAHVFLERLSSFDRIRIDVGLSFNAPFTKHWSENHPDTLILAIEPSLHSLSIIFSVNKPPYENKSLLQLSPTGFAYLSQNRPIMLDNMLFLPCALSNCAWQETTFYENTDPGTSSLYPPNVHTPRAATQVTVTSLNSLLQSIKLDPNKLIEVLKIDTQGNDLFVLLGAVNFLPQTMYVQVEISTYGQYKDVPETFLTIDSLMRANNFHMCHRDHRGDAIYLNNKFKNLRDKIPHNLLNDI